MKALFWLSFLLIFTTYVGYPVCLYLRARYGLRPIRRASIFPRVTIILAVQNEEKNLLRKLNNLSLMDYPVDRLEVIAISDGSTDQTNNILGVWQSHNNRALILPRQRGKANALNCGMAEAQGEIICFVDARQTIATDGLKNLVANFGDPSVGCASGDLILRDDPVAGSSEGVGLYWRLEKNIRKWEGLAGSTVGATGAFYAVRRNLVVPIPEETILDDVYIPLQIARQGKRVIFDSTAVAWDDSTPSLTQEFRRKVRTLVGNYQLLRLAPWALTRANPVRLQLICHKLLRLLMPFALVGTLISTFLLRQGLYELIFAMQVAFYALAASTIFSANLGFLSRLANISTAFIVLNTAAVVALIYFVSGKKAIWTR